MGEPWSATEWVPRPHAVNRLRTPFDSTVKRAAGLKPTPACSYYVVVSTFASLPSPCKTVTSLYMSISDIRQMSNSERLMAMEQLWDAICHEDQEPESPAWHETILKTRREKMDSPDARYYTIEDLRERFR
ncbi:MAG: addiction module protein [Opitutales bacterium]